MLTCASIEKIVMRRIDKELSALVHIEFLQICWKGSEEECNDQSENSGLCIYGKFKGITTMHTVYTHDMHNNILRVSVHVSA